MNDTFTATVKQQIPSDRRLNGVLATTPLTMRQLQVVQCLAEGMNPKQIGLLLHIETKTVWSHMTNARICLGAKTTSQAVARAISAGYVTISV